MFAAANCRFASTSASQGTCIFPCRCTNGCDTTTGDCLNDGQCQDGPPSGYRWSGPGCQTGNIAYHKKASESIGVEKWAIKYPAGKAVDGNTDSRIYKNSCAHPDNAEGQYAWWMVDLGETYRLSRVIIYNRDSQPERLNRFILRVGDSPDRATHRWCASHSGPVAAGATVNETCTAVGRYLSFKRDGGSDSHIATLCEVVVIGHRHISCDSCSSRCDEIIGCDACGPGKQQPDCTKACEPGTYGENCKEDCGHCKDILHCDVTTGHCTTGCETWYTTNMCKTHISAPHFVTSDKAGTADITSSSAVVTWPQATGITLGLESHYYYMVWFQVDGETWKSQIVNVESHQLSLGNLPFNTHYSVKVEPFRRHGDKHAGGTTTAVTTFKTKCTGRSTHIFTFSNLKCYIFGLSTMGNK
ncbi:hypothetical protein NP493_723g02013 [Ridgeia piscesae]|uniref:Fibronectin type-III domain-containing protein n=1 Tax=Ridgeia piscesae TaxID=27915 RepID=A0AAD9KQQ8_RIDPI|nr:hypothetical protein NP493_723g02013 [Ridgeia piscesae]